MNNIYFDKLTINIDPILIINSNHFNYRHTGKMTENYYTILNCDQNASHEQLKKSYQTLVKLHHPDKQDDLQTTEIYRKIDEAWQILKNAEARKEYDARLLNDEFVKDLLIYATLNLDELEWNKDENFYSYNCRCGGLYIVPLNCLEDEECIVNCDECSLVIQIHKNKK